MTADDDPARACWTSGGRAIDAHDPERVAAVFTEDAIFQGLHPYSVGREGVADYYDSPAARHDGRLPDPRNPQAHRDWCSATCAPTSRFPTGHGERQLGVLVTRGDDGWRIAALPGVATAG